MLLIGAGEGKITREIHIVRSRLHLMKGIGLCEDFLSSTFGDASQQRLFPWSLSHLPAVGSGNWTRERNKHC